VRRASRLNRSQCHATALEAMKRGQGEWYELTSFGSRQRYSIEVSCFAQIPGGQKSNAILSDTLSQSVRVINSTRRTGTHPGGQWVRSVSDERKCHASAFNPSRRIVEPSDARRSRRCGRVHCLGFYWGGWMTGSTANRLAAERADTAVVAALMPVCRRVAGRHSRGLPPPTITWLGHVQRS